MDEIYEHASSERIKSLERDLVREMKDLQNEIEDGSFLGEWNSYYVGQLCSILGQLPQKVTNIDRIQDNSIYVMIKARRIRVS